MELFQRYNDNPIISPDLTKDYENGYTYNPCAIEHKGKVYLIYRTEGKGDISTLCLAVSEDGYNFKKHDNNPIIKPTIPEEKGGCEDPRITKIGDTYYLIFTSYTGELPVTPETINTSLAVSKDMINWEKKGIIVRGEKSTALYNEKINGKYLLFIGGKKIRLAWSEDLMNWDLEEKPIIDIRQDKFDSIYVEVGPPPFLFNDKLVLFFNTTDKDRYFQTSLALLDKDDPSKVLYRADEPLMTPTEDYEKVGKVNNVIFGCGLIEFKGNYFYYYGGADKYVGVATISKEDMEKYLLKLM